MLFFLTRVSITVATGEGVLAKRLITRLLQMLSLVFWQTFRPVEHGFKMKLFRVTHVVVMETARMLNQT